MRGVRKVELLERNAQMIMKKKTYGKKSQHKGGKEIHKGKGNDQWGRGRKGAGSMSRGKDGYITLPETVPPKRKEGVGAEREKQATWRKKEAKEQTSLDRVA